MAKVLNPLMSGEARGKVGALIFNTSRARKYVKQFTSPAQPRTTLQRAIRAYFAEATRGWQALTAAQRTGWNTYGNEHPYTDWTGQAVRLTGHQWYVACYTAAKKYGLTPAAAAPTTVAPDAPAAFAVTDGAAPVTATWTAYAGTDKSVIIYAHGPHSVGAIGKRNRAKYYTKANGETGTASVALPAAGYYTCFAFAIDEDNGLMSPAVSDVVTAS